MKTKVDDYLLFTHTVVTEKTVSRYMIKGMHMHIYFFKAMPTNKEHLTVGSFSEWFVLVKDQNNLLHDDFQWLMCCHVSLDYWTCLLHGHLTTMIIGALWSEYGEGWLRKKGYVEVKQNIIYGKKSNWTDGEGKDEINYIKVETSLGLREGGSQRRRGKLPHNGVEDFPQLLW